MSDDTINPTDQTQKINRCFYLPVRLLEEGRVVSDVSGIPLSHLVSMGLRQQIDKQKAVLKLMRD